MRTLEGLLADYAERGDEDAMEALVARTRSELLRAVRPIVGADEAEDAVQAAYLALLRGRPTQSVRGWLYTTVVRIAYRRRAKQRKEIELAKRLEPERTAARDSDVDAELVRSAVAALPARYRDAVVLFHLNGLATEEIARLLDVAPATVRTRLHRGRALLRNRLGPRLAHGVLAVPWWLQEKAAVLAGGTVMSRKTAVAALVLLLAAAGGVWSWRSSSGNHESETRARSARLQEGAANGSATARTAGAEPETKAEAAVPAETDNGQLHGVVVDRSGTPLKGIAVLGYTLSPKAMQRSTWLEPNDIVRPLAISDANGRFAIDDPAALRTLAFLGRGYVPATRPPVPPLHVILDAAGVIEATVRDTDGRPIEGAAVTAMGDGVNQRVFTDRAGRATLATVPIRDDVKMGATGFGYVLDASKRPAERMTFTLKRMGVIVDVVDARSGAPIPGAQTLFAQHGRTRRIQLPIDPATLPGFFRMLPGRFYRAVFPDSGEDVVADVHVIAPGYRPHEERVTWKSKDEPPHRTIRLARGRGTPVLAGRITPATTARVEVRLNWGPRVDDVRSFVRVMAVTTDADGRFAVPGLPAGSYRLVATADGYGPTGLDVTAPARDVRIELARAATLDVTAKDAEGRPAAHAWVHIEPKGGRHWWEFQADERGRVAATGLSPGELVLYPLRTPGGLVAPRYPGPRTVVTVGPGQTRPVALTVPIARAVTIRMRAERGGPLPGVPLNLNGQSGYVIHRHTDDRGDREAATNDRGEARMMVWPGTYELTALVGTAHVERRFEVGDGAPAPIDIVVARDRGAVLRGRVFDSDTSAPIAGARATAWSGRRRLASMITGADGRFALRGSLQGKVRLTVRWKRGRAWRDLDLPRHGSIDADFAIPRNAPKIPFAVLVRDRDDGRPLQAVAVDVRARHAGAWHSLGYFYTDADGRAKGLLRALAGTLVVAGEGLDAYRPVQVSPDSLSDVTIELQRK